MYHGWQEIEQKQKRIIEEIRKKAGGEIWSKLRGGLRYVSLTKSSLENQFIRKYGLKCFRNIHVN